MLPVRNRAGHPVYARHLHGAHVFTTELIEGQYTYELHDELTPGATGTFSVKVGGKPRIVVR